MDCSPITGPSVVLNRKLQDFFPFLPWHAAYLRYKYSTNVNVFLKKKIRPFCSSLALAAPFLQELLGNHVLDADLHQGRRFHHRHPRAAARDVRPERELHQPRHREGDYSRPQLLRMGYAVGRIPSEAFFTILSGCNYRKEMEAGAIARASLKASHEFICAFAFCSLLAV